MKNNELNIFDVFVYIYRGNLFKFIFYTIILTIILSPIFSFLQKNLITEGFKNISVEIVQLDDFSHQDILLYEKINNLYQDIMQKPLDTSKSNEIFFNKFFDRDKFFYLYYDYFTTYKILKEINNNYDNLFSFVGSSVPVVVNPQQDIQSFTINFSTNVDTSEKIINDFIEDINMKSTNFIDNEFNKMKLNFETNNIFILENMYSKFEEELETRRKNLSKILENNSMNNEDNKEFHSFYYEQNIINAELEYYLVLIKKYLVKLESTNADYIGKLISNSKISVAEIKNIRTNNISSNFNFIIIRSVLLSFVISLLFIFFFFLFRLNISNNKS